MIRANTYEAESIVTSVDLGGEIRDFPYSRAPCLGDRRGNGSAKAVRVDSGGASSRTARRRRRAAALHVGIRRSGGEAGQR